MRRILVSALLVSASCLPALADPIQLIPSAFATHERAGAGAAAQARPQSAASGPRYVEANQPHYGGGFIELLFGGGARQLVAPRAYQPAAPDGGQPAQVPIALNMPMQGYAPSVAVEIVRPADTTAYAAGDSVNTSTSSPTAMSFAGAGDMVTRSYVTWVTVPISTPRWRGARPSTTVW